MKHRLSAVLALLFLASFASGRIVVTRFSRRFRGSPAGRP